MDKMYKLTPFEKMILRRVEKFEKELNRQRAKQEWAKNIQQKVDNLIPQKVHQSLAIALEKGIKGFLQGLNLLDLRKSTLAVQDKYTLENLAEQSQEIVQRYKKIAMVEGAGTGFGGIISSAVDFPLLISIKLKLMQELAQLFGYRLNSFEERLYILKIIQLQFSGQQFKQKTWLELKDWYRREGVYSTQSWADFDWDTFYMEYKQSIELRKLLQMIPGLGAIIGAWANHSFIDELGRTATLCLLWRKIQEKQNED